MQDGTMVKRVDKEGLRSLSDSEIDALSGLDTENSGDKGYKQMSEILP